MVLEALGFRKRHLAFLWGNQRYFAGEHGLAWGCPGLKLWTEWSGKKHPWTPQVSNVIRQVALKNLDAGHQALSGDWDLEFEIGVIESTSPFQPERLAEVNIALPLPADFTNELVLYNLDQPVAMALLPSGQMLVLER